MSWWTWFVALLVCARGSLLISWLGAMFLPFFLYGALGVFIGGMYHVVTRQRMVICRDCGNRWNVSTRQR